MLEVIAFILVALVALFGSFTQIYPGNFFIVAGAGVWAFVAGGVAWWWFAAVTAVIAGSMIFKFVLPARSMKRAGISNGTLLAGSIGGIVGFFAIPVVGLFVGFPLGVYVAERLSDPVTAWAKTQTALKGVGTTIVIEVIATVIGLVLWAAGMLTI